MKIVVAIKQVPDTESKITIGDDGRSIQESNITWIVNPYDEYAVEEALRVKESQGGGEVIIVTIGPDRASTALRTCLAMGADRAIRGLWNELLSLLVSAAPDAPSSWASAPHFIAR